MGFFDFLKAKDKAGAKAPPAPPSGPSWDDYPGAVELARRHGEESQAWHRKMLFRGDDLSMDDELEDGHLQTTRHETELASAVFGMSDMGAAKFKTVYHQVMADCNAKLTALIAATRSEDISWDEYPEAVALAERHRKEVDAPTQWLITGEDPPDEDYSIESVQRQEAAHKAELQGVVDALPEVDGIRFRFVYREVTMACVKRRTTAMVAATAIKTGEADASEIDVAGILESGIQKTVAVDYTPAATEIMAVFEDGRAVASEHTHAIQSGLRDGVAMASAPAEGRLALISEIMGKHDQWLAPMAEDDRGLCDTLYELAKKKSMTRFFKTQVQQAVAAQSAAAANTVLKDSAFLDHQVESIKFLAGDLGKGSGYLLSSGRVRIPGGQKDFAMSSVASVEVASEESVKRVGGAVGWGLAGAAMFGPAGFIVGGMLGGQGKDVTFVGTLTDGKRFMATAKSAVYSKFMAATFR